MAQSQQDEQVPQPGATAVSGDGDNDKDKELERMRKLLAAKDAEIAALKQKDNKLNEHKSSTTDGGDEDDTKQAPPKMDVTLSVRGIPEFDSYPYAMAADKFFYMASIKAPYFREDKRAAIDLVAVVDESGSMAGDRITLVKETVQFIIQNLESKDRFGIIGYSSRSREVLALTAMDAAGKKKAQSMAKGLRAQGGTALCQGLVDGVDMMRKRTFKNDIASVMILTDGQANSGPTSASDINACVREGKVVSVHNGYGQQSGGYVTPQIQNVTQPPPQQGPTGGGFGQYVQQQRANQMNQYMAQHVGQQKAQPPKASKATPNDMIADEDDTKQQPEGVDEGSDELPCTINTFGFGSGHNDQLLKALAENGRGMYAYIESTDQISDTFAECLGGLVSIIGQNLKIQVQALNNVEINRCLSKGYTVKEDIPKKKHTVSVKDLQSEESRDFIFELKVPQIESEKKEDPLVQLSVNYMNVVKGVTETLTNICTVTRIEGKQIGERNLELDLQYNRVLAADAMKQASELARSGKLADARKVLSNAQDHIKKSKTNKDEYSVALVKDIGRIQSNMQDRSAYKSTGSKMLSSNYMAQSGQRSCTSSSTPSQRVFSNSSKSAMMRKFKSSGK